MDSKLLSKTNMGGVATIILVILLCQARFFNFMVGTTLGRAVLVLLVLGITCAHHILGVIAVLAIIVIYNQSNVDYMEGFTKGTAGDKSMGIASVMPVTMPAADDKSTDAKKPAADDKSTDAKKPAATMPSADVKKPAEKAVAREGFNLIDRERVMQKGKRASDLIGVADTRQQSDAVEPNDPSCFADQAAQF
jgi:apolipoprotein N-acyltransferase